MDKLRYGVVGTGYLGRFHAQKIAAMAEATLAGVVDVDRYRAQAVACETGTRAYTDYTDLRDRVDAVSIVVPTAGHFEISRYFLANGVDVFVEKPMTATLAQADELIRQAASHRRLIQVGHLERFNPALLAAKAMSPEPVFIQARRMSPFQPRGTDVCVVMDLMIHDIDILLSLVPDPIVDIQARGLGLISSHLDMANARLTFANGCVADITASRISPKRERSMTLYQPGDCLALDFADPALVVVKKQLTPDKTGHLSMAVETKRFNQKDALFDELKTFIACVRSRTTPPVSAEMGRNALKTAFDVMHCIQHRDQ